MASVPELSVIVPTFGREEGVARAVQSALDQDVDLEVIVVDDGSEPPLALSVPSMRVVRVEQNQGAAAARNIGVTQARARWIAFLDSDDVWIPHSLRARLDAAQSAKDAERTIWAAGFVNVWPDGSRQPRVPKPSTHLRDFASGCWSCPGSTALFSSEAWAQSGGQDPALRRLEDYDWLFRWAASGGRLAIHASVAAEISRGSRAGPDVVEAVTAYLLVKHADAPTILRRRMQSYLMLELAASRLRHGAPIGGALALARSLVLRPRLQPSLEPFWVKE